MRKNLGRFFGDRRLVGGMLLIIQFTLVCLGVRTMGVHWRWMQSMLTVLSVIIVIWLIRKYDNPTYKLSWIIVILLLPLFGGLFYLLWGNTPLNRARYNQGKSIMPPPDFQTYGYHPASEDLEKKYPRHATRTRYLKRQGNMPAWSHTESAYFHIGEQMWESMCTQLRLAERFIFLEYFIIEEGMMWNTILEILQSKVREGVDVRMIYDDVGSIATLPMDYDKYLGTLGIRAMRFNRFIPTLNSYLNYRNHRKMLIIDGNIGYMGGINIADEYINVKKRFGHWKDTGIMLRGEATANMTVLFLQMWEYVTGERTTSLAAYLPTIHPEQTSFIQPFADSPLDDINLGESAYLQMINTAQRYVYITTPYLVLDNEMITALTTAAQSGVDVRIITPGIPDKKLVYLVTRSYDQQLFKAGVRIYEYSPGFLHGKCIVSDDDTCIVGTINMDFRSFYLHFECATAFYGDAVVQQVYLDILDLIAQSHEIDETWLHNMPWLRSIAASVLRLFAPML